MSIRYRLGRQVYFNVCALGLLLTTCFIRDGFSSLFFHYLCCLEVGRKGFQLYYLKKKSLENICKSIKRCWWYNTSERNPAYKIIYPGWHIITMWCQIHEGDNTTKCYIIFSGLENDLTCFNWYFLVFPKFCFEYLVNKHYIIFSEQCLQKYIHAAAQSCLGVLIKHKLICVHFFFQQIFTKFLPGIMVGLGNTAVNKWKSCT